VGAGVSVGNRVGTGVGEGTTAGEQAAMMRMIDKKRNCLEKVWKARLFLMSGSFSWCNPPLLK
jgi:hypothetical protein